MKEQAAREKDAKYTAGKKGQFELNVNEWEIDTPQVEQANSRIPIIFC